jgi:uncharacterized protein with GYD domain
MAGLGLVPPRSAEIGRLVANDVATLTKARRPGAEHRGVAACVPVPLVPAAREVDHVIGARKGGAMPLYLSAFSQTPETWAKLISNPENRREALAPVMEAAGCTLHGYWYAFGETDGFVLFEAPDDVTAAGVLVKVAASGPFSRLATTKLLTVEEAMEAFGRAGGVRYRPPGGEAET